MGIIAIFSEFVTMEECIPCQEQKKKATERQAVTKCEKEYKKVQECMTLFQGNIASCRDEWQGFRKCYAAKNKE